MKPSVSAVIVAAGNSTRMGVPKQFISLCGRPLLAHTLQSFELCDDIDEIVLVARAEDHPRLQELVAHNGFTKISSIVCGGDTRQQSVHNGVSACRADFVAIHDGARPLATPELIERVMQAAMQYGAAAAAVRTKDTVKIADANDMIVETPDRATVWNVQTPQIFKRDLFERAWENAEKSGLIVTDDCQLAEAIGHAVKLVEGSYQNIKVTTPEDVAIAEEWLK